MNENLNGMNHFQSPDQNGAASGKHAQDPVAIVGMACRLPDECNNPRSFWKFLEAGGIAKNTPPPTRYNLATHHNGGSGKEKTMASPGGMYLQGIDLADVDAQFFKLGRMEALSMDPQQRQLLEVVYEGLENAGITLEQLDGQSVGCFAASFGCDYSDMQARDPENRAPGTVLGVGRAMLSNRISHFLNIKGPSLTVDTACSGTLTCLDIAMHYLQTGEMDGAIVCGCNLYMSPEYVIDSFVRGTASATGRCWTFDAKADGYIKAEAVNMVYLKRLSHAIRDGNPVRAIIRGSAINSDGWTAGIFSPNSVAQAQAIRQAYANAGISDLSQTNYVEFHGTGTRAGDAIEASGVGAVFASTRTPDNPILVGSVKSNIGHAEPAAGISALIKVVLSLEKGMIPGNPTFDTPNPDIDFDKLRIKPFKTMVRWPSVPFRRASINCFGYGGSNAHIIVDEVPAGLSTHATSYTGDDVDLFADVDEEAAGRPYLLAFSANDEVSLRGWYAALDKHLSDPYVKIQLRDLAYTLSERRTRHFHRGFIVSRTCELTEHTLEEGDAWPDAPKIGFIFTGQGAQWPAMSRELVETYSLAKKTVQHLDAVLQSLPDPPSWSLYDELTKSKDAARVRNPILSQPLVTAHQLALLAVLEDCNVTCQSVVGHSSGEIAAAVAAGYLTPEQAIKIAYYRGKATADAVYDTPVGMMAVGLGTDKIQTYLADTTVQIACVNSPEGLTLSGKKSELGMIEAALKADGVFARLLQVDAAYHSRYMHTVSPEYQNYLEENVEWTPPSTGRRAVMYSSVTSKKSTGGLGPDYWVRNMTSPVLFSQALSKMLTDTKSVDFLVELGPSGALAGPVKQIKKATESSTRYVSAWKRGTGAINSFLEAVGHLFVAGYPADLAALNADSNDKSPSFITDLPNYSWNHATKYWWETESSQDWRFRKFPHHELLGSKVLGVPWTEPEWKKVLNLKYSPWLQDHKLADNVVMPASGYISMALEAIYQKTLAIGRLPPETLVHEATYQLRDVRFSQALQLGENELENKIILTLHPNKSSRDSWHEFKIGSLNPSGVTYHCEGFIAILDTFKGHVGTQDDMAPLHLASPADLWYGAMEDVGYSFGKTFQRLLEIEATAGLRHNRARLTLAEPEGRPNTNAYPLHPVAIDSSFQAGALSLWQGYRTDVNYLMIPALIDELTIPAQKAIPDTAIAVAEAVYGGLGRQDDPRRHISNVSVYHEHSGELALRLRGLRYHAVDAPGGGYLSHTYVRQGWNVDVSFLDNDELATLLQESSSTQATAASRMVATLSDLVAHKKGFLRVLEMVPPNVSVGSFWLDQVKSLTTQLASEAEFQLSLGSSDAELEARNKYGTGSNGIEFASHDPEAPFQGSEDTSPFDILLLNAPQSSATMTAILEKAHSVLSENGYIFVLKREDQPVETTALESESFECIIGDDIDPELLYLGKLAVPKPERNAPSDDVYLLTFCPEDAAEDRRHVLDSLQETGYHITEQDLSSASTIPDDSTVLVVDELFSPIVATLSETAFAALKDLVSRNCRMLWVTAGSQMDVTMPEHSLYHGVSRTLMAEEPTRLLMTLDVESAAEDSSLEAIHRTLKHLMASYYIEFKDREWVERGGRMYVSRFLPAEPLNQAERDDTLGPEPTLQSLFGREECVRLMRGKSGAIESLIWAEVPPNEETEVPDGAVEIEMKVAAMNFKDLANIMDMLPVHDRRIGIEGSGIISRIGKNSGDFKVGQRVLLIHATGGCLGNRVQCPIEGVQQIPDYLSFEDAATMGLCYATAIYSLMDLGHLQKGQTVLIHSAAGGVGLAAIQIALYIGAEVYATVGTAEKRKFLADTYGLADDHMFDSRSINFADAILDATRGRGIDVILNSLSGDKLHESWRCIGWGGHFIEIGRRDILDRNDISMTPFLRNASYHAFDLGTTPFDILKSLLRRTVNLFEQGHIKPLNIDRRVPWENVKDAFRYMREGKHIGKIVITNEDLSKVQVEVQPARPVLTFRDDRSYLIVGGFKGLCGSLAVYMVRNGVKHLVVLSRSGYDDKASQKVLVDLQALGVEVDLVQGDITEINDVRRAFQRPSRPIAGIVHGAMVLRDKIFSHMTFDEFHAPLLPKVRGTWNLHHVSQEQEQPLDFFTLLSSISGFGQRAQANYAAGNVFQDNFAAWRRSQGLAACAVDLGIVHGVGYFSGHGDIGRRLAAQGWHIIDETLLHKIFRFSLLEQLYPTSTKQSVLPVGGPYIDQAQIITGIPVPLLPTMTQKPVHRWAALRPHASAGQGGADDKDSPLAILKAGGDEHAPLLAASVQVINEVLTRSLGLSDMLDASRPLASYSIDSLVAVELRNWVRTELGIEISALDIVGAKTLVSLGEVVLKKLHP